MSVYFFTQNEMSIRFMKIHLYRLYAEMEGVERSIDVKNSLLNIE